jgi:Tfp pilus assembly ATPase PilU
VLIPAADGKGRHAAIELLMRTQGLPNIIWEGNTPMSGKSAGMQTVDESLMAHLQAGRISHHDVLARAQDKTRFETPAQPPGTAPAAATPRAA